MLATKMYTALVAFAAAIPVTMVTAAQMLASKTALKNAGDTFNAARTTVNNAHRDAKPAQDTLYQWLLTARAVIARRGGGWLCRAQHESVEHDRRPNRAGTVVGDLLHQQPQLGGG